ncbi:MAG: CRTAC1 family protein [Phycisphaerae bacterium]
MNNPQSAIRNPQSAIPNPPPFVPLCLRAFVPSPNNRQSAVLCALIAAVAGCRPSDTARQPDDSLPENTPRRAATAGGWFRDVTQAAGIDFVHDPGATGQFYFPENMGSGGAFLDFDGDGLLDIYLIQSGRVPGTDSGSILTNRLYRNQGNLTFTDVTHGSGSGDTGYGIGCAAADYDNDSDIDIYITNVGPNVLLRNDGGGHFTDVSATAGVNDSGFGASAVWLDYDRDGYLDLYVANYIIWSVAVEGPCYAATGPRDYCKPLAYRPQADVLYRNRGDGSFEDVTVAAGIGAVRRNGLGVIAADVDGDGWEDIYVANDQHSNILWINQRDGTFRDNALVAGCAVNADGRPEASMGIAVDDLDNDGDVDLFVTHLRGETHTYYRNDGGFFEDATIAVNLAWWNVPDTGFGTGFFDLDNDGRLDLFVANGAVNLGGEPQRADNPYAERNRLLHQQPDGSFADAADQSGDLCKPIEMGRGAVFGDINNDGRPDLLVTNNRGPARLFLNNTPTNNHWLTVRALDARSSCDAIGARVDIQYGANKATRTVRSQYSYLSSSDPRVHFGIGKFTTIDRLTIHWPSTAIGQWMDIAADRIIVVREGQDELGTAQE